MTACCAALAALLHAPGAHAAGSHVHGRAALDVVVDGPTLVLAFTSPLDDLVGFERSPRNERERAAVRRMAARLHDAGSLFAPNAEAECALGAVKLASSVIAPSLLEREPGARRPVPPSQGEPGHNELTAEIAYRCARPGRLSRVNVAVFDAFPRVKRIDARVAASGKQSAARLTAQRRILSW